MIGMIWAQARGGVIGNGGFLPWHLPEDLSFFRDTTSGHTVIMGRKTWDSLIPRYRPLPRRTNIVVTRDPDWSAEGAVVQHELTFPEGDVWVMGGGQIYAEAMPFADVLAVTEIDADIEGDTLAPSVPDTFGAPEEGAWQDSVSGLRFRHLTYRRER